MNAIASRTLPGVIAAGIIDAAAALSMASAKAGSPVKIAPRQRTKLWDLNGSIHCSIIGTCLTTGELRRVMAKVLQHEASQFSDHNLHAEAVGLCGQHNTCSKLLQKALDQRHETVIRQFGRLQGEAAVLDRWREARRAGEIPGAYWAVLTHPDVGHAGLRQAFGDVHMLSHLVGAANRADIRRLAALEEENASLLAKVERQQARLHDAVTSRDATIRRLGGIAVRQVEVSADPDADDVLAAFRDLAADLQNRLATQLDRNERRKRRLVEATEAARRWERRARDAEAERAAMQRELELLEQRRDGPEPTLAAAELPCQRILYVGGRPGSVEQMRNTLAASGGELLCHDGGRHDHPSLLPGLISQADRVMFPVDCVSHDAALTVKRLCRQLGKGWVPLRSSGLASFLAAVTPAPEPAAMQGGKHELS